MDCKHEKFRFIGQFSMIGSYFCINCNLKIDPVVYHLIFGIEHFLFSKEKKEELFEYLANLEEPQKDIIKDFCAKNNLLYPLRAVE